MDYFVLNVSEETEALRDRRDLLLGDLRALLALPPLPEADTSLHLAPSPAYCGWIRAVQELVLPMTAEAQSAASGSSSFSTWCSSSSNPCRRR